MTLNPSMHRSIWPYTDHDGQLDPRTRASTNVSKIASARSAACRREHATLNLAATVKRGYRSAVEGCLLRAQTQQKRWVVLCCLSWRSHTGVMPSRIDQSCLTGRRSRRAVGVV